MHFLSSDPVLLSLQVGILFSALSTLFLRRPRMLAAVSVLCGILLGTFFLYLGFEFLAVAQWVMSAAIGTAVIYYSIQFGISKEKPSHLKLFFGVCVLGVLLSALFLVFSFKDGTQPHSGDNIKTFSELNKIISTDYFIAFEMIFFLALVVLVGTGIMVNTSKKEGKQ